jgi:ElaB/YqjD/DUF883 family membrane-anchored ribosome-binding protein
VGKDPSEIREEIEQTRGEMGETVEALGHKADVKTRAKESVAAKRGQVKERISGATPDAGQVKQGAKRAAGVAQENPIGLALGSVAVGFVAGMLLPSTRVEDEKVGPMADDVKERVKETGQEALDRGKEVAQEAAQSARETAQQSGEKHAEELRDSAQQEVEETKSGAGPGSAARAES